MKASQRKPALSMLIALALIVSSLLTVSMAPADANADTASLTVAATDDTWMWGTTKMPGDAVRMNVASNGKTAYLKFAVEGAGDIASATLKVTADNNGTATIAVYSGSHTDWTEADINWTNRPAPVDVLDTLSDVSFQTGYDRGGRAAQAARRHGAVGGQGDAAESGAE